MFQALLHKNADRLLTIVAISFVVILALLPFHAFFSTWGGTSVGPLLVWKSWKEILLLLVLPLVSVYLWLRPEILRQLWARWYNKLIVAYAVLHGLWAVFSPASTDAVAAGLIMNLRFFALFLVAQLIALGSPAWARCLHAWAVPWLLGTAIILSVLGNLHKVIFS